MGRQLQLHRRPMANVYTPDTPIGDMLYAVTGGDPCATFHGQRGGEWDTLRETPLRVRQSLTTAGFFSLHGWQPDKFSDILIEHGQGAVDHDDPIDWYIKTAKRALIERQWARRRGAQIALAKANGHDTPFQHRDELARQHGYESYFKYRIAQGWGDGHGRRQHESSDHW